MNFRADHDAALAVAVGEVTAGHREKDEGKREQRADDQNQEVALLLGKAHRHDDVNDEELDGVVVEGVLELRDDQRPEPASPIGGRSMRDEAIRRRCGLRGCVRDGFSHGVMREGSEPFFLVRLEISGSFELRASLTQF